MVRGVQWIIRIPAFATMPLMIEDTPCGGGLQKRSQRGQMGTPNWIDQNEDGKNWYAMMDPNGAAIHAFYAAERNTWAAALWGPLVPGVNLLQDPVTMEHGLRDAEDAKLCAENLWKAAHADTLHHNS